jgi:hypothetical protein
MVIRLGSITTFSVPAACERTSEGPTPPAAVNQSLALPDAARTDGMEKLPSWLEIGNTSVSSTVSESPGGVTDPCGPASTARPWNLGQRSPTGRQVVAETVLELVTVTHTA